MLVAVTGDDRAIPSQRDSSPKLSIPGRHTVAVISAGHVFTLENNHQKSQDCGLK